MAAMVCGSADGEELQLFGKLDPLSFAPNLDAFRTVSQRIRLFLLALSSCLILQGKESKIYWKYCITPV